MKNERIRHYLIWFFLALGTSWGSALASEAEFAPFQGTPNDTLMTKVEALNELAQEAIAKNDIAAVMDYSRQAIKISREIEYAEGEIQGLLYLAKAHKLEKKYDQATRHYFEALEKAQSLDRKQDVANIYIEIGLLYRTWNTPKKALEYFEKAHTMLAHQTDVENMDLIRYIAFIHLNMQNYEKSLEYHERMLKVFRETEQESSMVITLRSVANIYELMGLHQQALLRNMEILEIKKASNDQEGVANYLNDIGYSYQKMKSYKPALRFFREALAKNRELGKPESSNVVILRNIGVIEHSLGNTMTALESYEEALRIVESEGDVEGVASTCNYISSIYMEQRNFKQAEEYTLRAVRLAEKKGVRRVLLKSYQRLTKIYELTYKTKKAYDYYRKYQELQLEINKEEISRLKLQVQKSKKADVMEEEVKKTIADKEKAEIEAERLKAENERKEQKVKLLEQDQALQEAELARQKLEKEKSEKESSLLKQRLKAQLQEQHIATMKQDQDLKDLQARQKEAQQAQKQAMLEKELETARELEEKNKRILQDEQKIKQYYNIFIALFGVIFLLVAISFYFKQKAHRKIKAQALELQEKNMELQEQREEILQKNEELHSQKEEIYTQKERIERSYVNMGVISKIGQKVTATLDMQEIMRIVYQDVKALMPADRFGIGKYNETKQQIEYQYYVDNGQEIANVVVSTKGERLAGWVVRNYRYVFMNDMRLEYERYLKNLEEYSNRMPSAIICIPLAIKGKVMGLINVQSQQANAYEKYHLDMLQTLANYVSIAVYNSDVYGSLKNANQIIQEKNKHITDSIRYAQTIQQAVLPNVHDFEAFTSNFVLFLPKDIVSGDFYWVHVHDRTTYVAAVDCTGHGVPGAFMSMLGNDILDETVGLGITHPPQILETLHQRIFERLDQKSGTNDDGMDVCLCKITYPEDQNEDIKVVFAGAKRPLFYHDGTEIQEIKGSNKAIGGNYKDRSKTFVGISCQLKKGNTLYLTTDGYIDQNNTNRRKFGTVRFTKMLDQLQGKPMDEQRTIIEIELQKHQGEEEQRDDITVIGIEL